MEEINILNIPEGAKEEDNWADMPDASESGLMKPAKPANKLMVKCGKICIVGGMISLIMACSSSPVDLALKVGTIFSAGCIGFIMVKSIKEEERHDNNTKGYAQD